MAKRKSSRLTAKKRNPPWKTLFTPLPRMPPELRLLIGRWQASIILRRSALESRKQIPGGKISEIYCGIWVPMQEYHACSPAYLQRLAGKARSAANVWMPAKTYMNWEVERVVIFCPEKFLEDVWFDQAGDNYGIRMKLMDHDRSPAYDLANKLIEWFEVCSG